KYEFAFGHSRFAVERLNARCPSCRYDFSKPLRHTRGGDRVLVLKYLYRLVEPKPWDVVVFRNPQDNSQNYIKRLVGLPGETIEIVHGDVFVKTNGSQWRVRRKPRRAQKAMWQVIFDNDYPVDEEIYADYYADTRRPRWDISGAEDCWQSRLGGREFVFGGSEPSVWKRLTFSASSRDFLPDYGYNSPGAGMQIDRSRDVCTDLKLSMTFQPQREDSRIALALSSFEHRFKGEIHADGTITLLEEPSGRGKGGWTKRSHIKPLEIDKAYQLALTHADFKVTLWVNDEPVLASDDADYTADYNTLRRRMMAEDAQVPTPRIAILAGGGPCHLRHVLVMRDVFYTCPDLSRPPLWPGPLGDYARANGRSFSSQSQPLPGWGVTGNAIELADRADNDLDEFFVLGDNSPESLDGRGWVLAAPTLRLYSSKQGRKKALYHLGTVPRYNMIGKAFFVYWPAGFSPPGFSGPPIIPNVGRMRLVR
ncbi:MAG: signal peptidase I, partial [Planctomycetes bacterium]|nr:signal peptidase I [Planctomycetota bacterium]